MHSHVPLDHIAYSNRWSSRHPLEKAYLTLGLLPVAILLPPLPAAPLILTLVTAVAVGCAGVPARLWFRLLAAQSLFLLLAAIPLAWQSGWPTALSTGLRSAAATACLLLLALTTPVPALLSQAARCRAAGPLVDFSALVYRFLSVAVASIQQTRTAVRQRLAAGSSWGEWVRVAQMAARVLCRTMDRAMRLERGLQCRGLAGGLPAYHHGAPLSRRFLAASLLLQLSILLAGALAS